MRLRARVDGAAVVASQGKVHGEQLRSGLLKGIAGALHEVRQAQVQALTLRSQKGLIGGISEKGVMEFERGIGGIVPLHQDLGILQGSKGRTEQLAVDREVKYGEVARPVLDLQPRSDLRGGLAPIRFPLFQGTRGNFWVNSTGSGMVNLLSC